MIYLDIKLNSIAHDSRYGVFYKINDLEVAQ